MTQLTTQFKRLENREELPEQTKALIDQFVRFQSTRGLSQNRLKKYASNVSTMARFIRKPLREASRDDLAAALMTAQGAGYKTNTLRDFKVLIRIFYQWLYQYPKKQYPPMVAWIEPGAEEWKDVQREDLIEAAELQRILDATPHTRDKAAIALLWATGARAEELLGLKVKDFYRDQVTGIYGVQINGTKTKYSKRDAPVTDALVVKLVQEWIESHPCKSMPSFRDSYLWVRQDGQRISYALFNQRLRESHKLAGVSKPANPHQYRHSHATFLANTAGITRSQFCYVMGWAQSSKVPDRYLHTSKRDAFKAFAGVLTDERDKHELLAESAWQLLSKALQDPEVLEVFKKKMKGSSEAKQFVSLVSKTL